MSIKLTKFFAVLCVVAIVMSSFNAYLIYANIQAQQQTAAELARLTEALGEINQASLSNVTEIRESLSQLEAQVSELEESLGNVTEMRGLISQLEAKISDLEESLSVFESQTPADIYESTYKSVVVITTDIGQGSGFLYNNSNTILTNWHVVEGETEIYVQFYDGTMRRASLVGLDAYSDVAVLTVSSSPLEATPLKLGNSSNLYVGQQVVTIGNPLGLTGSLSSGFVSQINKVIDIEGVPITVPVTQLDITLAPGNSGGPLLDMLGNVVGITNAGTNYGFNFAITSNNVKRVVESIIEYGNYSHPFVGFSLIELSPDVIDENNILNLESFQSGLLVWEVIANYPAEHAGLIGVVKTTDSHGQVGYLARDIVLAVDGHSTRTIAGWTAYVEENVSPGQTVVLTLWRSGVTATINITVTSRPPYG